ncbi:Penicillin-binding protein A [Rubrobacter xylanophilus DSM 9941]|uniref:peptidoglycan D,D-transpeptidase FtsI family protein n=1 Tax=Rubrobacter xylanophilus TaxID=49319 RepID=UPI001C643BAF|nr:penicillin-binding protein 2 [Rubrobacter xylanophilus]QYJ16224.1 Penicillin-binding protein A [Rubrobacter xylanophilus DSM 9941]
MNAHVRRTFYLFVAGFAALIGMLAYWQVYARESLANNPENGLQTRRAIESPRGLILARDGETVLARSVEQPSESGNPTYERVYPQGPLYAGVVGYWSTRYGATGIEIAENSNLSGNADPATLDELINQISGGPRPGNNVTLTIDPQLQRLAYELLAASNTGRGSVVAVDPKTGEILALVSHPSYDPNNIDDRFRELQQDPSQPLLNRATQGLYPPGSVFKVVTAAAALKSGVSPTDVFFDDGTYEQPGYTVTNYGGASYGRVTFAQALALSINTVFAQIAVEEVGRQMLYATARDFGFGSSYEEFPLEISASRLGEGNLAQIAFGQDTVLSNVFQMALVAATVANGGTLMEPHLVKEVRSPDGIIIERASPQREREVLDPQTAATLREMMVGVVENGSATAAQIPGIEVAGKTGTAEVPPNAPHSWFIAFAPANDPRIAVAVLVENGGDGEKQALPIARQLIASYLDLPSRTASQQNPAAPRLPQGLPQQLPGELQNLPQQLFGENGRP